MRVWSDVPTPTRREVLWIKEGKKCHFCGKPTRLCSEIADDQATTEHLIPRSKGGTNDKDNLASSCLNCNQRRNHEDNIGLTEGSLLGKYKINNPNKVPRKSKYIALTGDEKKAITSGTKKVDTILREQRDQAQAEITNLKRDLRISEGKEKSLIGELTLFHKIVEDQEKELNSLKTITVWSLIRRRVAAWIQP
jgi:hypothetical protein